LKAIINSIGRTKKTLLMEFIPVYCAACFLSCHVHDFTFSVVLMFCLISACELLLTSLTLLKSYSVLKVYDELSKSMATRGYMEKEMIIRKETA